MKFFAFSKDNAGKSTLWIDGPIAMDDGWFTEPGTVTSKAFRRELAGCSGDIDVYINSPGGDLFAGADIYTALKEYAGKVTICIPSLAASAGALIAMAGDEVLISPVGYLMIHKPWTFARGNDEDMEEARAMLQEITEGMIPAFTAKSGKTHEEIMELIQTDKYLNATSAIEMGFADGLMLDGQEQGAQMAARVSVFAMADDFESVLSNKQGMEVLQRAMRTAASAATEEVPVGAAGDPQPGEPASEAEPEEPLAEPPQDTPEEPEDAPPWEEDTARAEIALRARMMAAGL